MKRYGKSKAQQHLSRREFLRTAGLASAGLVLAKPSLLSAATAAPDARIKRGGTHVRGDWLNVTTLDPLSVTEQLPLYLGLYNFLFSYRMVDAKTYRHELKGELVESWERPDPTTFVFKLRKGVKFHDGSDWNADVAAWNLNRLLKHPKSAAKAALTSVDSVGVVDDGTIKLKLKQPSASLLLNLSSGMGMATMAMVSKAAMEKMGETGFAANPVGSGPFRFEKWVQDDRVTFKRFDGYWEMGADGKPLPYLDGFVNRYAAAPQLMLMLRTGEIEATRFINPEDVPIAKADPTLICDEMTHASRLQPLLGFNGQNGVLSKNLKLRQAALHALDRKTMAEVLGFGTAVPHFYPWWGSASLGWDESIKKYDYDPKKAKQLVAEAGYPKGVDISLMIIGRPNYLRDAEVLKNMWDAVGLRTKVEPLERAAFNQKGRSGKGYDVMFTVPQITADQDLFSRFLQCGGPSNRNAYCSKELDECMNEADAEYDISKRDMKYKRCLSILQDEAFHGTGYALPANFVYKKYVKGYGLQWENPDPRAVWLDK
jgi:ABC-type transport system substrate-binding protein